MQGERLATRQELDWPFQLGPVKAVPYAMGEAAHWGEDQAGQPLTRLWGQAGVRATLPMWSGRSDRLRRPAEHPRHRPQGQLRCRVLHAQATEHLNNCRSTIRWTTIRSRPFGGCS